MSIPLSGLFEYKAVITERCLEERSWPVELTEPITFTGQRTDNRLVGHSPTLTIAEDGLTPPGQLVTRSGMHAPRVQRSRLTLTASSRQHAEVNSASFHVDQNLLTALCPGDMLFMARTGCGCIGLSIVRGAQLITAVGAVTAVPLGKLVSACTPRRAIADGLGAFQKHDPEFEFNEYPVEIRVGATTRLLYFAHLRLEPYDVRVEHGFLPGIPGTNECVSISMNGVVPGVVSVASAQLLDLPGALEMKRW